MNQALAKAIKHWQYVAPVISRPKNAKSYETMVSQLDELLDIVGDNETHPLMPLVELMGNLIAAYEEKHYKKSIGKGVDALKYLMKAHQLCQSDLSEIGSQGVVSEILNGKRTLNLRQIQLLAKRFKVSADTFIDN